MSRARRDGSLDRLSKALPAWTWILLGWVIGGATRIALEAALGADAGPLAVVVVMLLWVPALRRLADVSGRDKMAFAATVVGTVLIVSLLPPFEEIALRLPVEIALTVPAAARWIDRPSTPPKS
jgi:hypothetical protein